MVNSRGIIGNVIQIEQLFSESLEVIAHRGNSGYFPENTMAAYRSALQLGCTLIEVDVQLSADRVPVLIHDTEVSRVSTLKAKVADLTYGELANLDVGSWFSSAHSGEGVPSLQDFVALLEHERAGVLLEFKGDWHGDDLGRVTEILAQGGFSDRVIAQSFSLQTVGELRNVAPDLRRGLLTYRKASAVAEKCAELQTVTGNPDWKSIRNTPAVVQRLQADGRMVMSYTVNKPKQWQRAADIGLDAVFTDFPEEVLTWRAEHQV